MSKRDILIFLFKWKYTILGSILTIVSMVTALAYLMPPDYIGKASLLVESNRAPTMRSSFSPGLDMLEVIRSEAEIVRSRTVMEAVVTELRLHERPSRDTSLKRVLKSIREGMAALGLITVMAPREQWVGHLLSEVEVEPVPGSNVLNISYFDSDPEWAAQIVNTITDHYIKHHLAIYSSQGVSEFYQRQIKLSRQRLARLRKELVDFKEKVSISAIEESQRGLVQELGRLRQESMDSRSALTGLLERFEADHSEARLLQAKIDGIMSSMALTRNQLQDLETKESRIQEMEIVLRSEENTYLDYNRKHEEARLSELSNTDMINVRLIEYSAVAVTPRFSRLFLILVSIPAGLICAFLIAFIREYLDHRITDPEVAERALSIPHLGSIEYFVYRTKFSWTRN